MRLYSPLLLLLLAAPPLIAADYLTGSELNTMVSGKTAHCKHLDRPSQGRTYFNPNGTMHGIRRDEARIGSWYVEGNTLCTNWGIQPACSRYQSDGKGGHYKFKLDGKKVVHVWQWSEGDVVESQIISENE